MHGPAARPDGQLEALLEQTIRAPSSHNSQPWLFRVEGRRSVTVLADRRRALPVVDPEDRELTISLGAALGTLEAAARAEGLEARVAVLPDPAEPDALAHVMLAPGPAPEASEIARAQAIEARRTVRAPFGPELVPGDLAARLSRQAAALGVALHRVTDATGKAAIAALVSEGDETQFHDPRFRRELAAWVHSYRLGSRDGMSSAGFGMPDILAPVARFVIRSFDIGGGVAASDAKTIAEGSPALWLLATGGDGPADWLATGRALAPVLLDLRADGWAASWLNQPIEVAALRPRLAAAAGAEGHPQILLRVGRPAAWPAATMRRPLSEVLAG